MTRELIRGEQLQTRANLPGRFVPLGRLSGQLPTNPVEASSLSGQLCKVDREAVPRQFDCRSVEQTVRSLQFGEVAGGLRQIFSNHRLGHEGDAMVEGKTSVIQVVTSFGQFSESVSEQSDPFATRSSQSRCNTVHARERRVHLIDEARAGDVGVQ